MLRFSFLTVMYLGALLCGGQYAYAETPPPDALTPKELIAPQPAKQNNESAPSVARTLSANHYIIAAGAPEAAEAGARVMERGGHAIDAVIAAQAVLNVVEPQASGIGGGAFLLYYDAREQKLYHYDGRETAPAAMSPLAFQDKNGRVMPYKKALEGGRSVGVPGLLKMLDMAHHRHGHMAWNLLFKDAVTLAEDGIPLSVYLHELAEQAPHFMRSAASDPFKNAQGELLNAGDFVMQPALADTLRAVAAGGADNFYNGPLGAAIARAAQRSAIAPGTLTEEDMAGYEAKERPSVCVMYRLHKVCGPYPPSSGGVTVLQALKLLERYDLAAEGGFSANALHLIASATRTAFADRNMYIGDPDFLDVPVKGLLHDAYITQRAAFILPAETVADIPPGTPGGASHAFYLPEHPAGEPVSTTHISARDMHGNIASMTSSIEYMFGSAVSARGFLLNNQLTDFAFDPQDGKGGKVANAAAPGKRPRSSMTPVMVFSPDGTPLLVTGSPGGSRIISYVLQQIIAAIDFKMTPEDTARVPRFTAIQPDSAAIELEEDGFPPAIIEILRGYGWKVVARPLTSGTHTLMADGNGALWNGAADPRRDGAVAGR